MGFIKIANDTNGVFYFSPSIRTNFYAAISVCPSDMTGNPTVIAAQAANELLGIRGIRASFVMTEYENQIYISARSIDEVNVQTIMEKLGGGGHMNVAGAQLRNVTLGEARSMLKDVLMAQEEKGDEVKG